MGAKKVISFILAVVLAVGFVLPTDVADAFQQFPRSLAWELMSQSGVQKVDFNGDPYAVHYVQPGETVQMHVTVRNRSRNRQAEMWYGASSILPEGPNYPNAHAIGLGTWDPMDNIPSFLDPSSFVINGNRFAYYNGEPINKGQSMTLNFQVKIKDGVADGTYDLVTSFVREFDEWGWRDNGRGQNHRYRSMLWKFVVGDEYNLQTTSDYSVGYTTFNGEETIYFKDASGGVGYPMIQAQALQIHRGLNDKLGTGRSWKEENMEEDFLVGVDSADVFFVTQKRNHEEPFGDPDFVATSRIYAYNTQSQVLRLLLEYQSVVMGQLRPEFLHPLAISDGKLIVYKLGVDSSPGPCYTPWLNETNKYSVDLSQSNPSLVRWETPLWKYNEARSQLEDFCLEQNQ
jgi:hypothetical protein